MIPAAIAFLVALGCGLSGWRLVPDTWLYSRDGWHLWPAPLSNVGGQLAGETGVIVVSAIAAGICVFLVGRGVRRYVYLAACAYWFAFPGVDALGVVFVLLMLRAESQRLRAVALLMQALVHPVAALTSFPMVGRRTAATMGASAVCTIAAIGAVGLLDGFTTTDRYVAPLLTAAMFQVARGSPRRLRGREGVLGSPVW